MPGARRLGGRRHQASLDTKGRERPEQATRGVLRCSQHREQTRRAISPGAERPAWEALGMDIATGVAADSRPQIVLELFERYYDRVYCFARRSLDPSAAEDIAQEVFTRLMECEGLEEKVINSSYLVKIADNLIKRRYRRRQKLERILREELGGGGRPGRDAAPERDEDAVIPGREAGTGSGPGSGGVGERAAMSAASLATLRPNEQDAVMMIVCRGLSYQQAADALGSTVTAVNNWKFRGLRKLRDADRTQTVAEEAVRRHGTPGRDSFVARDRQRAAASCAPAAAPGRVRHAC